jgi:hypothetical protein
MVNITKKYTSVCLWAELLRSKIVSFSQNCAYLYILLHKPGKVHVQEVLEQWRVVGIPSSIRPYIYIYDYIILFGFWVLLVGDKNVPLPGHVSACRLYWWLPCLVPSNRISKLIFILSYQLCILSARPLISTVHVPNACTVFSYKP